MHRSSSVLWALLAVFMWGACDSNKSVDAPTQIMLRVRSTDNLLLEEMKQLRASVALHRGDTWRKPVGMTVEADALRWPVDIPITPKTPGDDSGKIEVVVEATDGTRVLAQNRAVTRFEKNKRLVLELWLYACPGREVGFVCASEDCRGEDCAACTRDGACLEVGFIDPSALAPLEGSSIDAGLDAAAEDATTEHDALEDAGGGAPDADATQTPTYVLGEFGGPCSAAQEQTLACGGHASRASLRCEQGVWQVVATCTENERCDSRMGTEQGTCATIPKACEGKAPGDVCDGNVRLTCGVDLVDVVPRSCPPNAHCSAAESVSCVCDVGYHDDGEGQCVNPNDCPADACSGGTCVDGLDDFSCSCPSGYAGTGSKACVKAVYCPFNACTPGGTCLDQPSWSCQCNTGFSGTGTQTCSNINNCPQNACLPPGGTCTDGVDTYSCSCSRGFSGPNCQNDICSPNPCRNNGTCSRTGTLCACAIGFSGSNCQIDVCNPTPCVNAGTCSRTSQGATCACRPGFTGPLCQTDINECALSNQCILPEAYPCAQTVPAGYVCQGQFADWHMPDRVVWAKFPPAYALGTPGIVVDNVTGLTWQKDLPVTVPGCTGQLIPGQGQQGDGCSWAEARAYCQGLSLAGQSDWRLPSHIELASLLDDVVPTIDQEAFPGAPRSSFWSASPSFAAPNSALYVNFGNSLTRYITTDTSMRARCVRNNSGQVSAGVPAERYVVDLAANTILDTRTALIWERTTRSGTHTFEGAKGQCAGGFRLPSRKELLTLLDPTLANPMIDGKFRGATVTDGTPPATFWAGNTASYDANLAFTVDFAGGASFVQPTTGAYYVRCVR